MVQKITEQIGKTFIGVTEVALDKLLMDAAIRYFSYCQDSFGSADIAVDEVFVQVSVDSELMENLLNKQTNLITARKVANI